MEAVHLTIRSATRADSRALADLHAAAWRHAYRGIIPWMALERMIAHWRPVLRGGMLVLEFDGVAAGYASFGAERGPGPRSEIYDLYLRPEYQGTGLGRRLFKAARTALEAAGRKGLGV